MIDDINSGFPGRYQGYPYQSLPVVDDKVANGAGLGVPREEVQPHAVVARVHEARLRRYLGLFPQRFLADLLRHRPEAEPVGAAGVHLVGAAALQLPHDDVLALEVARHEDLAEDAVHLLVEDAAAQHGESRRAGSVMQLELERVRIHRLHSQPRQPGDVLDDELVGDLGLSPYICHGARVVPRVLRDGVAHAQLVLHLPDPVREAERLLARALLRPCALHSTGTEGLASQPRGLATVDVDGLVHGEEGRRTLWNCI